ncbi:hypothetical protein BHE74_00047596 [Ensete ventricosum]|nr:hypothetical protein BHE74_00047596 [Ensete ventricosum]
MESKKRKQWWQARQQQLLQLAWVAGEDGMRCRGDVVEKQGWPAAMAGRRGTEVADGGRGGQGKKRQRRQRRAWLRAAGSDEKVREEGEEGAVEATTEEGYGQLEAAMIVVEEERRWWPGRGGSGVRQGLR